MSKDYISKQEVEEVLSGHKVTKGRKIIFASNNEIRELRPWVDQILEIIGYPEAMVSNESYVGDFCLAVFTPKGKEQTEEKRQEETDFYRNISEKIGLEIKFNTRIIDLAKQLKDRVKGEN